MERQRGRYVLSRTIPVETVRPNEWLKHLDWVLANHGRQLPSVDRCHNLFQDAQHIQNG